MPTTVHQLTGPNRASGRSVVDYDDEEQLREALASCTLSAGHACGSPPAGKSDWVLPVPDPEAEEQSVNSELRRLLVLKSYLLLDAEKEEAFERLTEEACKYYNVPTSVISLVDLGRQFFFSSTGLAGEVRETPRVMAFCSHTILSKSGICVVNDCTKDPRFHNNELVTEGPKLRFYAGAPLISPEGYKLGTFCVEGPDPRPQGLTHEEQEKLKDYAAKTMALMVERRQKILQKSSAFNLPSNEHLRRHAAVATNLGGLMYDYGEFITAMRLFQDSVQTLMFVEEDVNSISLPSIERQRAFSELLEELTKESVSENEELRKVFIAKMKSYFDYSDVNVPPTASSSCKGSIHSIPGLFSATSRLKSVATHRLLHGLIFGEAFKVSLEKDNYIGNLRTRPIDDRSFVIPLEQCSKATLFNMGLIHYHWGSPDSAMQFFDLAASLSQQHDALTFDPVILGCLNNMAQIHLQYGRPNDAMDLLSDAVTRGNAALVAMYGGDEATSDEQRQLDMRRTRRLRKKLARTVMNMGHVHFVRCDFDASFATCKDALRLLHTNMDEMEVAAVWYNSALLNYYKGNKAESLNYLDKFLDMAVSTYGRDHLQVAEGLHRKGQLYYETGKVAECMPFLSEALEVRRKRLGEFHPAVADSYCLIGKILLDKKEYDFSLVAFEKGLAVQRALAQDDISFEVAQTLLEIGRIYHLKGQLEKAIEIYSEVHSLTKKFFGETHLFVARISNILGNLFSEMGKNEVSNSFYSEASRIQMQLNTMSLSDKSPEGSTDNQNTRSSAAHNT